MPEFCKLQLHSICSYRKEEKNNRKEMMKEKGDRNVRKGKTKLSIVYKKEGLGVAMYGRWCRREDLQRRRPAVS